MAGCLLRMNSKTWNREVKGTWWACDSWDAMPDFLLELVGITDLSPTLQRIFTQNIFSQHHRQQGEEIYNQTCTDLYNDGKQKTLTLHIWAALAIFHGQEGVNIQPVQGTLWGMSKPFTVPGPCIYHPLPTSKPCSHLRLGSFLLWKSYQSFAKWKAAHRGLCCMRLINKEGFLHPLASKGPS